jgi:WD40 repeat protein
MVTDIDWNNKDARLLASCSMDGNTQVWDSRNLEAPAMNLNVLSTTSQVRIKKSHFAFAKSWTKRKNNNIFFYYYIQLRWHPQDKNFLSTAQETGDLRFWDTRWPVRPVSFVAAHSGSRLLSMDWSFNGNTLLTSGHDCIVRLTEITDDLTKIIPGRALKTSVPVWKAR